MMKKEFIRWFETIGSEDVGSVGGKNASLGQMISNLQDQKVRVPGGFALTASAYRTFIENNQLAEGIRSELEKLHNNSSKLSTVGKAIRRAIENGEFPQELKDAVKNAYAELGQRYEEEEVDVAVRSSATAEDLPEASFAGQQESFLNVSGADELLEVCRRCYASLFTDRAISYREEKHFDHMQIALSVGVQKMVRSDLAGSGVMFTVDTETGFPDVVVIDAAWGLGENVVQGSVNPDEYRVYKPLLKTGLYKPIIEKTLGAKQMTMVYATSGSERTKNLSTKTKKQQEFVLHDDQIIELANWAVAIEELYDRPMDVEWALDGQSNELYIVQARPETVQSQKQKGQMQAYALKEKGEVVVSGLAIGSAISAGPVFVLNDISESDKFESSGILVTGMTDPDWVPLMRKAAGIITDQGGRTSHAAIVSRELSVPAVIGTGNATEMLNDDMEVTLSCAEGETGNVYKGRLEFETEEVSIADLPETRTKIMMNVASPDAAFVWWQLPVSGVGLARMEFIINNVIRIHPLALIHPERVEDKKANQEIKKLTRGYEDKAGYFVDHLSRGIAKVAAAQYPDPVIVRLSDFKTNEYAQLIGGSSFEPEEENPMLGFRGAARYYSERYKEGFALECRALKKVREDLGFENVVLMVPFCRTLEESERVLGEMAKHGLTRGERGLQVYVMCEIPSNIVLADEFAQRFDGFSIGTNDLTQLVLGVDRDSSELAHLFDERNEAVKRLIRNLIDVAHSHGVKVGICGQAPSDHPDFAAFLVDAGIDSISLNPDRVVETIRLVARQEEVNTTENPATPAD